MSIGFVTASGKGVTVSEQALENARKLFETIDKEQEHINDGDDAAVPSVDTPTVPMFSTPARSVQSLGRLGAVRRAAPFRSPAFINPRPLDGENIVSTPIRVDYVPQSDGVVPDSVIPQRTPVLSAVNAPTITPSTPTSSGSERSNITPIKLLTPYCRNWRLCIKVVCVEGMRQFRGTNIFSFSGVDDDGVEIRFCAFNQLAQKVTELIKLDQMYYIRRAFVKPATKRFSRNQYDMEVILRDETEIIECTDRPEISSPKICFEFIRIKNLLKFIDREVDVLGVVKEIGEVKNIMGKMGEALLKRDVQIVDDSLCVITVALWGDRANNFNAITEVSILVAKRVFVRCYHGSITLSLSGSSKLEVDMDLPEVNSLRRWYTQNKNVSFALLSTNQHKWIGQVKPTEKAIYFNITAMIMNINVDNAVYKGCAIEGCRKKLIELDGKFKCPKCGITSDDYKYFYTLSVELCDMSGTHWASIFDDCAVKLLGQPADEVAKIRSYNYDAYSANFRTAIFKTYEFRVVARRQENEPSTAGENMQREISINGLSTSRASARAPAKMRWSVIDLMPVNYDAYIQFLVSSIQRLTSK